MKIQTFWLVLDALALLRTAFGLHLFEVSGSKSGGIMASSSIPARLEIVGLQVLTGFAHQSRRSCSA
jgi:hypothetical protein